jgi:hypothetical protein
MEVSRVQVRAWAKEVCAMRALNPSRRWALVTIGLVACAAAFLLAFPATAAAAPGLTITPTTVTTIGTASNQISNTEWTRTGSGFAPGVVGTMTDYPWNVSYQVGPTNANGGFTQTGSYPYPTKCDSYSNVLWSTFDDGHGGVATSNTFTWAVNPGGGADSTVCPSPVVQFASMNAQAMMLMPNGAANDSVGIVATFKLGTSSNGIDPAKQPVKIDVGSLLSLGPLSPSSFTKTWLGWTYRGQVNGIQWTVAIVPLWDSRYVLTATATRLNLASPPPSIDINIAVGDDQGSTSAHPLVVPRN